VRIARELIDEVVAHARADAPNECCGMIAADDGRAVRVYPAENVQASPLRYEIDPREIHRVMEEIEGSGWRLGAIYHSHTRSEPYPSQTDIGVALVDGRGEQWWPGTIYVIVGVAGDEPEVRAYDIRPGGDVVDVALEVES
jgi:[CysO sulfur-carrier protein]-S-L-cysteine hydrolase